MNIILEKNSAFYLDVVYVRMRTVNSLLNDQVKNAGPLIIKYVAINLDLPNRIR